MYEFLKQYYLENGNQEFNGNSFFAPYLEYFIEQGGQIEKFLLEEDGLLRFEQNNLTFSYGSKQERFLRSSDITQNVQNCCYPSFILLPTGQVWFSNESSHLHLFQFYVNQILMQYEEIVLDYYLWKQQKHELFIDEWGSYAGEYLGAIRSVLMTNPKILYYSHNAP